MNDKRVEFIYKVLNTTLSIIRLIGQMSFLKRTKKINRINEKCIVMGNGPSLLASLAGIKYEINNYDLVAVNFMALSDEYTTYKPNIYILCDPAFWFNVGTPDRTIEKVHLLYSRLLKDTDWEIQIYLPRQAKKSTFIQQMAQKKRNNISLNYYNKTKVEGFKQLNHFVYNKQWGMPRPQNVINAALMIALHSEYKEIFLFGAENDWLKNIKVDEQNNVIDTFKHFYKEKKQKSTQWGGESKLHNALLALSQVFKSYVEIEEYSVERHQKIYNSTPGSYIDAFERKIIKNN